MIVSILTAALPVVVAQDMIKMAHSKFSHRAPGQRQPEPWHLKICHRMALSNLPSYARHDRSHCRNLWAHPVVRCNQQVSLVRCIARLERYACRWMLHVLWSSCSIAHFSCGRSTRAVLWNAVSARAARPLPTDRAVSDTIVWARRLLCLEC